MFGITRWQTKTLSVSLALALTLSLWGCGGNPAPSAPIVKPETRIAAKSKPVKLSGKISEASPPEVIQQLRELLEQYQPQVSIASPKPNEVLQDNTVSVQFNVKDLPIFKDEKLGLGPHLHVFLDDQPYQAVYDVSQPLVLKDLAPGTHTLRVFAGRPWHESFKNDGAYAQVTFHVFTKTPNHDPNPALPLLTYSRPQGKYGAEPIMLDFYLTNAPLHLVAQEDAKDDVSDWRIRVTVNGDSFTLDRWQPIYLKGFKPGKNWVQLEYIDERGQSIQNVYNNTARIFTYEPNGNDTLAKLTRGELSLAEARGIVDPNYKPEEKPAAIEPPIITPEPSPAPIPVVPIPKLEEKPVEPIAPQVEEKPIEPEAPKVEEKIPETVPAPVPAPKPKGGFFNRFKRPTSTVAPSPEAIPTPTTTPSPEPIPSELPTVEEPEEPKVPEVVIPKVEETPAVKEKPKGGFFNRLKRPEPAPRITSTPEPIPSQVPAIEEPEEPKVPEVVAPKAEETPEVEEKPKGGFFDDFGTRERDRFKRAEPAVSPEPTPSEAPEAEETPEKPEEIEVPVVPEVKETPALEVKETPKPRFFDAPGTRQRDRFSRPTAKPTPIPIPKEPTVEEEQPAEAPKVPEIVEPEGKESLKEQLEAKETPKAGFFNRFQRPGMPAKPPAPSLPPVPSPEMIEPPTVLEKSEEPEEIESRPAPEAQETPKPGFFNQFKRPAVKPSPSAVPEVLNVPENAIEESEILEPEVPELEVKEAPRDNRDNFKENFFERLRRPKVKRSAPTEIQEAEAKPKAEEPATPSISVPNLLAPFKPPAKPAPSSPDASEIPGFEAQSELERRLGVPLKPMPTPEKVVPPPVAPKSEEAKPAIKFEVPKSSDLFKRKETNPFLRSLQPPTSEEPPATTPEPEPILAE